MGEHDLTSVIAAAKSLVKFKSESSKGRGKNTHEDGNGEGDRDNSSKRDPPLGDKGNGKKDGKLTTLVMDLIDF